MNDVQRVRLWLESQPFELRMVTLILLMTEAVESQYGADVRRVFERELKEAYRNASGFLHKKPKLSAFPYGSNEQPLLNSSFQKETACRPCWTLRPEILQTYPRQNLQHWHHENRRTKTRNLKVGTRFG